MRIFLGILGCYHLYRRWLPSLWVGAGGPRGVRWPGLRAQKSPLERAWAQAWGAECGGQLRKFFSRSVQLSPLGEGLPPPFFSDSSSSRSRLRWYSVSLTGVSTAMWEYMSPG